MDNMMQADEIELLLIDRIEFDLDTLTVQLGNGQSRVGRVEFNQPRAFQFFNESDNYTYLESLETEKTILSARDGSGIICVKISEYLMRYKMNTPASRLDLENYSCVIVTSQECIEVIVFEDPKIYLD